MPSDTTHPPATYTPVSRRLLDSSVWEADPTVRVLWVTMLIIASEPGRRGTVDMTLRALAGRACLTVEQTRAALDVLAAPDLNSRSREHEGRRVALLDAHRDWGWRLLNWPSYEADRARMLAASRQARFRATTKRVQRKTALRTVACDIEKEEEKEEERERERGERGESLSHRPSVEEARELWSGEGLRGDPERFVRWHSARGWDRVADWREAARLWSSRERVEEDPGGVSDWGRHRPPDADEALAEQDAPPEA